MKTIQTVAVILFLVAGFASADASAAKENFDRSKPHVSFFVGSPGLDMRNFEVVVGPGVEVEAVEYQNGDDPLTRKRPGRVKYGNIVLKRGYTGASDVEAWALSATQGRRFSLRNITISVVDQKSETTRTYELMDCFPTSWSVTTDDKGVALETVVLAVGYMEYL